MSKPKYKVGDTVIVIRNVIKEEGDFARCHEFPIGTVGEIVEVHEAHTEYNRSYEHKYEVGGIDNFGDEGTWVVQESDIDLYTTESREEDEIKKGDTIKAFSLGDGRVGVYTVYAVRPSHRTIGGKDGGEGTKFQGHATGFTFINHRGYEEWRPLESVFEVLERASA